MKIISNAEIVTLFDEKKDCCGCGACMNICPRQAITMEADEYGFYYPNINADKCISCKLCKNVCGYQLSHPESVMNDTWAAVAKDSIILKNSASGGVFAALAFEIIKRGGVVVGCSMENKDNQLHPEHILVDSVNGIIKLQGSKYVHSFIGNTYQKVKQELLKDRLVLFSGTPCQVDGLKSFLGNRNYENLLTIDLICHGVPSVQFFQDYIKVLEQKLKGSIIDFKFRDKSHGWGLNAKVFYMKNGNLKSKLIPSALSSYYRLFLDSMIYRENCYTCKYANSQRVGDLTIGDFWGIEAEHPECGMDCGKGVSCIITNTKHGARMLDMLGTGLERRVSVYESVERWNEQLKNPSYKSKKRDLLLGLYKTNGYREMENWYKKSQGLSYYILVVKSIVPYRLKRLLKRKK